MTAAIIIAFRDRGVDPCRAANLKRVLEHWEEFEVPVYVVSDGRVGADHFNRSCAYNRGAAATDADILIYIESDILIDYQQVRDAITMAEKTPGLVIPFTHQKKLTETDSALVRAGLKEATDCTPGLHPYGERSNYGCVNVISRRTLELVGRWDEVMEGHGHDDNAMEYAFRLAAGPTRWVEGPSYHLYHLDFDPVTAPDKSHLTEEDIAAQQRNYRRLQLYRNARTPEQIRQLTTGYTPDPRWGPSNWRTRWIVPENDPTVGRYTS